MYSVPFLVLLYTTHQICMRFYVPGLLHVLRSLFSWPVLLSDILLWKAYKHVAEVAGWLLNDSNYLNHSPPMSLLWAPWHWSGPAVHLSGEELIGDRGRCYTVMECFSYLRRLLVLVRSLSTCSCKSFPSEGRHISVVLPTQRQGRVALVCNHNARELWVSKGARDMCSLLNSISPPSPHMHPVWYLYDSVPSHCQHHWNSTWRKKKEK